MISGIVETGAGDAAASGRDEQEIAAFIMRVAQSDLSNLEQAAGLVHGNWALQRSSQNRTTGWLINEAKSIHAPLWLSKATHRTYVKPDVSREGKLVVASTDLTIEFREGGCFTGEQFKQPKYNRGGLEDSIRAQPPHGGSVVSLFSIENRDVNFHYLENSDCISKIVFFGRRSGDGSEH